jgi:hypothetical protein
MMAQLRLTSPTFDGKYRLRETILPAFAHNPQVLRAPDGSVAIFAIGNATMPTAQLCGPCANGSSPGKHAVLPFHCPAMQHCSPMQAACAQAVNVWTAPSVGATFTLQATLGMEPYFDNPAPLLDRNGSAIVMWRGASGSSGTGGNGSIGLGTTADWKHGPYQHRARPFLAKFGTRF